MATKTGTTRNLARRAVALSLAALTLAWLLPGVAFACSPPLERPTIASLGPDQVVVVGWIGDKVEGGRVFHVQRWFNGGADAATMVIAFKEGEPVGDCSYPVSTGQTLIIAPYMNPDGELSADLTTLQADPASDAGRQYVAEANAVFGPGVVPPAVREVPGLALAASLFVFFGMVGLALSASFLLARRRRDEAREEV